MQIRPRPAPSHALPAALRRWAVPALLAVVAALPLAAGEALVQAQFNQGNDQMGNRWDPQQDGSISDGSNDCFDGGMNLSVNGNRFSSNRQQQTKDGRELVLTGQAGSGLTVVRRLRLDQARGAMRYLEVLTNTTDKAITATVVVDSQLGGSAMGTVWSTGAGCSGGSLPKGAIGIIANQHQRNSRPSVIFLVGEAKGPAAPTVMVAQNRNYSVTWRVQVPARSTRAVLHIVAQRNGQVVPADAMKAFWKRKLVDPAVPKDLLSAVVNFRLVADDDLGGRLPRVDALAERAGIEDRTRFATVGMGEDAAERMQGALAGGPVRAATWLGDQVIDMAEVAAFEQGEAATAFHLRSGEVVMATTMTGAFELATEGGLALPIDPQRTRWLVAKADAADGRAVAGQAALLSLVDGTVLALADLDAVLPMVTAWGPVEVRLADLTAIRRVAEPRPGLVLSLADGSRLAAVPVAGTLEVASRRFGKVQIPTGMLAGLARGAVVPEEPEAGDDDKPMPGARLAGGDVLNGPLAGPHLVLQGEAGEAQVPTADIIAIERPEEGRALAVVLRSGARLAGEPAGGRVAVQAAGRTWTLPVHRLLSWRLQPPAAATAAAAAGPATAAATASGAASATTAAKPRKKPAPPPQPDSGDPAGEPSEEDRSVRRAAAEQVFRALGVGGGDAQAETEEAAP